MQYPIEINQEQIIQDIKALESLRQNDSDYPNKAKIYKHEVLAIIVKNMEGAEAEGFIGELEKFIKSECTLECNVKALIQGNHENTYNTPNFREKLGGLRDSLFNITDIPENGTIGRNYRMALAGHAETTKEKEITDNTKPAEQIEKPTYLVAWMKQRQKDLGLSTEQLSKKFSDELGWKQTKWGTIHKNSGKYNLGASLWEIDSIITILKGNRNDRELLELVNKYIEHNIGEEYIVKSLHDLLIIPDQPVKSSGREKTQWGGNGKKKPPTTVEGTPVGSPETATDEQLTSPLQNQERN